jgi:hypothetical protein
LNTSRSKHALVLGSWITLHLITLAYLFRFSQPIVINKHLVGYPSMQDAYRLTLEALRVAIHLDLYGLLAASFISLTLFTYLVTLLIARLLQIFSLTRQYEMAESSVRWGVRNFFTSGLFLLGLAMILVTVLSIGFDLIGEIVLLITIVAAGILLPLLLLNPALLGAEQIRVMDQAKFPRLQSLVACILIGGVSSAISILLEEFPLGIKLVDIPLSITVYLVLNIFVNALCMSILINRVEWRDLLSELRKRANFHFIASWLLPNIKLMSYLAWLLPPLLVLALYTTFVVPVTVDVAQTLNQPKSMLFNLFLAVIDTVANYWWLGVIGLFSLVVLIYGRFLILYDTQTSSDN